MKIENVRIEEKSITVGHQLTEATLDYYDVQISVLGHWWSLVEDPHKWTKLEKALNFRDLIKDMIKGR